MASKALYLIGHPVAHSKSPAMHNAAYRALGLDWKYELADCASEDEARAFLEGRAWQALNVTMPYKPLACAFATDRSVAAELAQGANVLVNWDGKVHADNTDGKGCVAYLQRCGVTIDGARVVVCGTGPTSRAIMHACTVVGASSVTLLGRDVEKAECMLDAYRNRAGDKLGHCDYFASSYDESAEAIAEATLIVDATPLGMKPGDPAPFDTSLLSAEQVVFDVVYGHGETALLHAARAAGCRAFDGAGMLVAQAVETVKDIADTTGEFAISESIDLFAIMTEAAGFDL